MNIDLAELERGMQEKSAGWLRDQVTKYSPDTMKMYDNARKGISTGANPYTPSLNVFDDQKREQTLHWLGRGVDNATAGMAAGKANEVLKPYEDRYGVMFERDGQGMVNGLNVRGTLGNYQKWLPELGNQAWNWMQTNPWKATGIGAGIGAAALGGGWLLNKAFGGGDDDRMAQPPVNVNINNGGGMQPQRQLFGAQSLSKMGMFGLMDSAIGIPSAVAQSISHPQKQESPTEESYEPHISAQNEHLQKLLQDPKMRAYIINLVQNR